MRATRESGETKEKNNYLSRLLRGANENVRKLEEKSAEFESKLHKREEEFRRADNDRMRRFFNARFDDIPGSLQVGNDFPSARKTGGFNDQESFTNYNPRPSPAKRGESSAYISTLDRPGLGAGFQSATGQGSMGSQGGNDSKFLEGKVKKLENELNKALEEIRSKELIINRFKEWQLADKYLAEDEVLRDAIENQKSKVTQVHE